MSPRTAPATSSALTVTTEIVVLDRVSGARETILLALECVGDTTDVHDFVAVRADGFRIGGVSNDPDLGWYDSGAGAAVLRGREVVSARTVGTAKLVRRAGTDLLFAVAA